MIKKRRSKYNNYEDELYKVVGTDGTEPYNGQVVYICECKSCGGTHKRNSRDLLLKSMSRECPNFKPSNWTGAESKKDNVFRRHYGISLQEARELLEFQDNECAICCNELDLDKPRGFYVDHDHDTGEVRGLLCCGCNTGLGQLGDSIEGIENALNYLKNTPYSEFKYSNAK